MAFTQKPTAELTKRELKENIRILKSGEDFPNKEHIKDFDKLIKFHEEELESRSSWWQKDDPLIGGGNNLNAGREENIKDWIDNVFSWGEQGADIYNKFKGGVDVNVDGDKFEILPDSTDKEIENNKMVKNVIIGVSLFVALGVGVLIYMKNADKRK